jgi:O-antigen/teichoic acid export membrane protein
MGAGITLALNFWWIPVWGYMGAAWATFICYFCMMLVCYFLGKKYYPIPYHLRTFVISILLALGIYFFHQLISTLIQQQESAIWFVRVLLLALFGGFIWWFEKKNKRLLSSH